MFFYAPRVFGVERQRIETAARLFGSGSDTEEWMREAGVEVGRRRRETDDAASGSRAVDGADGVDLNARVA